MAKIINNHEWGPILGEGAWGKVRKCVYLPSNQARAVKIFYRSRLERKIRGGIKRLNDEVALVQSLHHPNIIKYYELDDHSRPDKIYLFMELCRGNIYEETPATMDFVETRAFIRDKFKQLLLGLEYLHDQRVAHHDVKPDNVLITSKGIVKICDFGVAERAQLDTQDRRQWQCFYGTPAYQPPEVVSNVTGEAFDGAAADLWSAGVLLFQLIHRGIIRDELDEAGRQRYNQNHLPFMGETVYLLYKSIEQDQVPFPEQLGKQDPLLNLVYGLLEKDPRHRLTATQALAHPFFNQDYSTDRNRYCCSIS